MVTLGRMLIYTTSLREPSPDFLEMGGTFWNFDFGLSLPSSLAFSSRKPGRYLEAVYLFFIVAK